MHSSQRTIERLSASASELMNKYSTENKEQCNIVESSSLLNDRTDEQTMQYEWEIDNIANKQQTKDAKLSQDIILALIAAFVIVVGLAACYIFIFDYYSVEDNNQQQTNTDALKFTYIETQVRVTDIKELYNDLIDVFDESSSTKSLLAASVRLAFSDCAGPMIYVNGSVDINTISVCNGCIDIDLSNNAGLHDNAVEPLEKIYFDGAYDQIMSRADFWVAVATIALDIAAKSKFENQMQSLENFVEKIDVKEAKRRMLNSDNKGHDLKLLNVDMATLKMPFYFGRRDCHSTPFSHNDLKIYPSVNSGFKDTYNWFDINFGLNERETVAILGAHTLVNKPNVFDNEYYKWMLDKSNKWHLQSNDGDKMNDKYISGNGNLSMFKSDLCLVYNINAATKCDVENGDCATQQKTYDVVQKYATNNQQFYTDFAAVWDKMVTIGYSSNMLTKFLLK